MKYLFIVFNYIKNFIQNKLSKISADALGWTANVCMHAATIPAFFAMMTGLSDKPPSIDIILMLWAALMLQFFRAVVLKDLLNIITIGVGFMLQAMILALIYFK